MVEQLRVIQAPLAAFFEHALPLEVSAHRIVVGFEPSAAFHAGRASEADALEALTRAARAHFGAPTQVVLAPTGSATSGVRSVAAINAERRSADLASARAAIQAHPVVQEAMRLFGAQLREVKLPAGNG